MAEKSSNVSFPLDGHDPVLHQLALGAERAFSADPKPPVMKCRKLAKAFRGEMVAQNSHDEPAAVLLQRNSNAQSAEPSARRGRGRPTAGAGVAQNGASTTNGHRPEAAAGEPVDLVVTALLARGRATSADVHDATGLDAADFRPVFKSLERLGTVAVEGKARGTAYRWLG